MDKPKCKLCIKFLDYPYDDYPLSAWPPLHCRECRKLLEEIETRKRLKALADDVKYCKKCKKKRISHNGYCDDCDPTPIEIRKYHDPSMSPNICFGWQTEEKTSDGRTLTVVWRVANYDPEHKPWYRKHRKIPIEIGEQK